MVSLESNLSARGGVRQGDPLSPLLFVQGSDLFQSVVNDYMQRGVLKLPIQTYDPDFPVIQYADDTILVMQADLAQIGRASCRERV